jgi:hypothetical protein
LHATDKHPSRLRSKIGSDTHHRGNTLDGFENSHSDGITGNRSCDDSGTHHHSGGCTDSQDIHAFQGGTRRLYGTTQHFPRIAISGTAEGVGSLFLDLFDLHGGLSNLSNRISRS